MTTEERMRIIKDIIVYIAFLYPLICLGIILVRKKIINEFFFYWETGNFIGKCMVVICAIFVILIFSPVVIGYLLYIVLKMLVIGIEYLCFPKAVYERREIPIPNEEILQKLREMKVEFIIGKDYIAFKTVGDYRVAKRIVRRKKNAV